MVIRASFIVLLCLRPFTSAAQVDLPVFGRQQVINGYAKDIEGEVLSYFSVYPEHATTALLTRCTDGKKGIAWETAAVPHYPQDENIQYFYFSWIAAHNSTTSGGDRSFDLFINDQVALTFTTQHNTSPRKWTAAGADSVKLVFEFSKMDRHGDAHGFAHLRVPRKYITLGQPVKLKVVGHAQDSPDWFMTFRYTFEEKVELEAMPFITAQGKQVIQVTAMHFGPPALLGLDVNGKVGGSDFLVEHGLNVFRVMVDAVTVKQPINVRLTISPQDRSPWPPSLEMDTTLILEPVIHRDIHLVHHSHTDIGYSHLQAEVETIQNNNIYKALALIDRTNDYPEDSRFVWNVESLWAVENFLGIASEADKQRFIAAVKSGSIALSANYANILTGLCTPEEMHWIVEYADSLRKWYDLPITMAMQTDVPGMSWSMVDAYAAHGIHHLSQGPNYIPDMPDGGDRIGSTLREQGDKPYWWKGTTGRDSILVWTAGQGYGGWHGYTAGAIKERGTRKIAAYMNELAAKGYPYDMVQWRYNIVSDNGPVDSTLSDFVRGWNEKYASPRLIIANAGTMMQEFETKYGKQIPTWSGDFTPYWEDGAYSTAAEEGMVRDIRTELVKLIDLSQAGLITLDPDLVYRAKRCIIMWHEHTWGAWCSISDPDSPFTTEQWKVKRTFADSAGVYVDLILRTSSKRSLSQPDSLKFVRLRKEREVAEHGESLQNDTIHFNKKTGTVLGFPSANSLTADTVLHSGMFEWVYRPGLQPDSATTQGQRHLAWKDAGDKVVLFAALEIPGCEEGLTTVTRLAEDRVHISASIEKSAIRDKESLHLALPFNIPNATVRIGIGDTCVTPESGRIPGSNNDFFCAQRWIDVSNDSMGVTIVSPQGAIWEVGDMVDERKVNPGKGTNPEMYKAWKTEAKSSSTIYLYALNNYWHTNFKADQEGPITFDLYLKMHGPFKLEEARRFGLEMTRPLITWWK